MTTRAWAFIAVVGLLSSCGAAKKCNSASCAFGCCDSAGTCQLGASTNACGTAGSACLSCALNQTCSTGTCIIQSGNGGGSGGGTGGGSGGGTGGGSGGGTGGGSGGGGSLDGGFSWGNAAGLLAGPQLGAGTFANNLVSKSIQVTATGDARFEVITAQLDRANPTDENGYISFVVRNIGTTGACFVSGATIIYSDSTGATVHDAGAGYFKGSVGLISTVTTNTCLAPNEAGVMIGIVLGSSVPGFFSRTVSVRWGWSTMAWPGTKPSSSLLPQRYSATIASGYTSVTVDFLNQGPVAVRRPNLGLLLPLDAQDKPLRWSFMTEAAPDAGILAVGGTHVMKTFEQWPGTATKAYARVDEFSDCVGCKLGLDLSTPEGLARLLQSLTDADVAMQQQLTP